MTGTKNQMTVFLNGGGPWGFRLQGGAGTGLPLVVSKVRRKSKAYKRLHEGDLILTVNGKPCEDLTYDQVMEIADKNGTDLTLEILRQESNKENQAPVYLTSADTAVKTMPSNKVESRDITKEVVSVTEMATKITEENEGIRIKSVTLLPDNGPLTGGKILDSFTSQKLNEEHPQKTMQENKTAEPFTPFSELLQTPYPQGPPKPPRSPIDTSTSSKTEAVSSDDNTFVRTATETKHEVRGNTETSFMKKEQESMSKSISESNSVPDITLDTIDLNNLISATQKKLDSFKNGFKLDNLTSDVDSSLYEVRKTEIVSSSTVSESKSVETSSSLGQKALICENKDSSSTNVVVNSTQDLNATSGGLGFPTFPTNSSESSYVTTETPFGSTTVMKKKKMFSSSSFYEEPQSIYPTMEEQVEMARKIADSLADDTNQKSKGANMFFKRVRRSSNWIHEGPEPSDESAPGTPEVQGGEPPTPDPTQVPFKPSRGPSNLKLMLDPRHTLDATGLRSSGVVINEHNVISPDVCHGLVKDLHSPVGKGAALFAKRKKKSEEWVVDEEKVKDLLRKQEKRLNALVDVPVSNQYSTLGRTGVKLVKTPWEAAMESPFGLCDSAFARVNPDHLADTVIKAADTKRRNSVTNSREPSRLEGCVSPPAPVTPAAAYYDIYHAKAPKGWTSMAPRVDYSVPQSMPSAPSFTSDAPHSNTNLQNGGPLVKKMVFQNFNTVPRLWKGASAH